MIIPKLTLSQYLTQSSHKVLTRFSNQRIVQLRNLRIIEIIEIDPDSYQICEITARPDRGDAYSQQLHLDELIENIAQLANNKNMCYVTWNIDAVLALNRGLSKYRAKLPLDIVTHKHNPNIEIVSKEYEKVFTMIKNGIDTNIISKECEKVLATIENSIISQ